MANSYFEFKKFTIYQDRCAMKVGTDGVLLGAWADVMQSERILDVGCGTGLISLMVAQRSQALVFGLEIESNAVQQACENVSLSPWKERIYINQADFRTYCCEAKFDLIVSNPPYFKNALQSPDQVRNTARHDTSLSFYDLITKAATLLNQNGHLSLIVPTLTEDEITKEARSVNLVPVKRTYVRTTPFAQPKRLLITFGFSEQPCVTDFLTIELSRHVYSREYVELTSDYYLHLSASLNAETF